MLDKKNMLQQSDLEIRVCEKGYRNKPLSDEAKNQTSKNLEYNLV
jgi:hypothetical protein